MNAKFIYSEKSLKELNTCHPDLQSVFWKVLGKWDHTIIQGHRSSEQQQAAFKAGTSKLKLGKHNPTPSRALDAAPYPFDFSNVDEKRLRAFGGFVLGVAYMMGIDLRWGGDWDRDWNFRDQSFNDLFHFELFLPE